ncbi:MAG: SsrA-binding protein SmpB [Acidobacteria bacterium]|nr:SsrA-binding protein SmpB [Acidobacteriota bacterium]
MKSASGIKILADNRRAGHEYELIDKYEAGMVLTGTEVKAAKLGRIQLRDAYADVLNNEAWLKNAHISEYSHGNIYNHLPVRERKLLLHKAEIEKLHTSIQQKGLTIVPTKMYLKNGKIKIELAVGRGKKLHDKRASERAKEANDEAKEAMARKNRQ